MPDENDQFSSAGQHDANKEGHDASGRDTTDVGRSSGGPDAEPRNEDQYKQGEPTQPQSTGSGAAASPARAEEGKEGSGQTPGFDDMGGGSRGIDVETGQTNDSVAGHAHQQTEGAWRPSEEPAGQRQAPEDSTENIPGSAERGNEAEDNETRF